MPNQFDVAVPNALQALMAGEQGYKDVSAIRRQTEQDAARRDAAMAIQSGDPNAGRSALARLLGVGDVQGANAVSNFGQQDWERNFRTTQANRTQSNADRSFDLQKQTANTAQIVTAEDASGNKTPIRVDRNGNATVIQVPGAGSGQPGNPYSYGKQTETQSKDSGYANRMFRAESVLRDPKVEAAATSLGQNVTASIGEKLGPLGNYAANRITSPDFQKYDQAKRDFVNAVLRRESGAAISQSEFDNAHKQYFPQPGDTSERIAEKRKNRQDAIAGVAGGGGQHYRPPFIFDQNGNMIPSGNLKQGVREPVRVNTPDEARSLPPGTPFVTPDGRLKVR